MKAFRDETGLSQQELAGLIGVSQAMIALCEKGKRELPSAASLRYEKLVQDWVFEPASKATEITLETFDPRLQFHVENALTSLKERASKAEKAIARLKTLHERSLAYVKKVNKKGLHVQRLKSLTLEKAPEFYLKVMESSLRADLNHHNPALHIILSAQMDIHRATLEITEKAIAKLEKLRPLKEQPPAKNKKRPALKNKPDQ